MKIQSSRYTIAEGIWYTKKNITETLISGEMNRMHGGMAVPRIN